MEGFAAMAMGEVGDGGDFAFGIGANAWRMAEDFMREAPWCFAYQEPDTL